MEWPDSDSDDVDSEWVYGGAAATGMPPMEDSSVEDDDYGSDAL